MVLTAASVIVAAFVGLNLYTYASQRSTTSLPAGNGLTSIVLPVKGMTCLTCELTIESSLKRLIGVSHVDARVSEETVHIHYDPARVSPDDLIAAINKTGYKASPPQGTSR